MLPPDTIDEIDGYWAGHLGCPPVSLFDTDVVVLPHSAFKGYQGLFLVRRGERCMITAPAELMDVVHTLTHGRPMPEVFGSGLWREKLPDLIDTIVGPGYVGYADASTLRPVPLPGTIGLEEDEGDELAAMQAAADPAEWSRAGMDGTLRAVVGHWEGGGLTGAAGYEIWGERIAQLAVYVRPECRGRGIGRGLISAIAEQAIEDGLVAQFRMLKENQAALSIAQQVGFEPYAETFAIGLNVPGLLRAMDEESDGSGRDAADDFDGEDGLIEE
jgi:GNAT superfamily N-acetyltransferase